jgi:hypothetical protein
MSKSVTTSATQTPLFVIVEDRKFTFDLANISIERTATGAQLRIAGFGSDPNQILDLATFIQSIQVDAPVVLVQN